ncbi:hypothetical protein [uncultured Enterovirga sp.]|uniref:hypothetical protein n=1 Tax=uncultured Enterovirga sp. TaxID=2026352 RepID=UPI0035CB6EBE
MAKVAKLRVYCMPAGFYDAVVAAPSQKAALRAWGTTTDLFAAGRASIVEDEALQAEALARPGEVIRRSRGNEAAMLGPEPPEAASPRARSVRIRPLKPDRSRLDTAERALAEAEREVSVELNALEIERADLDRRLTDARARGKARIASLEEARRDAEGEFSGSRRR